MSQWRLFLFHRKELGEHVVIYRTRPCNSTHGAIAGTRINTAGRKRKPWQHMLIFLGGYYLGGGPRGDSFNSALVLKLANVLLQRLTSQFSKLIFLKK